MENKTLIEKADIALADLANGGKLLPETSDRFIRKVLDEPTMLKDCRSVTMTTPEKRMSKIGFGSRLMRRARQTAGSRRLTEEERYKPDFGSVTMNTTEFIAEVNIPYEVLEDNIERGDLKNTLLSMIAVRAALDFEELALLADTAYVNGDDAIDQAYLSSFDGVLKLASAGHGVNGTDLGISPELFNDVILALPTKYSRIQSQMAMYVHNHVEQKYRFGLTSRLTGMGDQLLLSNNAIPVFGVPLKKAAMLPQNTGVYTHPQNILFGIQRDITMEFDKDIRERQYIIVLTTRVALQMEETDCVVKINHINDTTPES